MLVEMAVTLCFCSLLTLVLSLVKLKRNTGYWRRRGVQGPRPHLFFGNMKECYTKRCSYPEKLRQLYLEHRRYPVFGYFSMMNPVLAINDPSYVEKILKTDFSCFTDRVPSAFARRNELHRNLFNLNGPQWKAVRNRMAPVFTAFKLKSMTPLMERCFENTRSYIRESGGEVDMKEVASVYSHDVIVQCLFGIESRELSRPGTRFRRMQTEFFDMTLGKLLYCTFIDQFPRAAEFLNLTYFSERTVLYFRKLVETAINQRSAKNNNREDLVQILLKMREKRTLDVYDWEHSEHRQEPHSSSLPIETLEVTDTLVESQAMIFFQTGVESLVASLCFAVYELSRCPEALTRLREEVDEVTRHHGSALTPKALNSMAYLNMVIKETLRLYPVVPQISRVCSRTYELPCGLTLEPGEKLTVPVVGLHVDPEYFTDPLRFNPERFVVDPLPFTYLPFGEGPRICFAMKFVTTELKVGLFKLVQGYDFRPGEGGALPDSCLDLARWTLFMKPSSPVWIHFTPRHL